jgi:ATP-dependent exoDNAse (exonuclease V) beta subunit
VERICGAKAKQEGSNLEPHDGVLKDYMHLDASATRKDGYVADGLPRIFVEALTGKSNGKYPNKCQLSLMAYSIADRLYSYAEKGEPLSDMALLLGVTTHADLYIDAIRARGMQCVVTGGSTFTSTPEVKVVCALLHTLANFSDTASGLFPLLASEMFGLDADDFCLLGTRSQEKLDAPTKRSIERGLIDMEFYGGHRPSVRLARAHDVLMHARKEIALRPIADVCLEVIRSSGWLARLEAEGATGLARAANVLAAVRYIRDLTSDLGLGAARAAVEFDQWLGLAKIPPASLAGGADQAIKIMTIHASKGLEFPVVAVAECWNNPEPERDVLTAKLPNFQGHKKAKDDTSYLMLGSEAVSDALRGVKDFDPESLGSTEGGDQSFVFSKIFFSGNLAQMKQEQAEKARLLYVALTRAREALIVGINCASGANGISSQLASGVIGALGADLVAGLQLLDYGGSERCTVRTTEVRRESKKQGGAQTLCVDSANTLGSFDGSYTDPDPSEFLGLSAEHPDTLGFAVPESGQHTSFDLKGYRAREDVFSYSSAHALLERQAARSAKPSAALYQDIAAQTAETPDNRDVDKATNLGSAFHELAQIMVESGQIPDARRIEASAAYWHLSSRATSRLRKALLCWEGSDIRKEALSHELVFAEQPFFATAPFGTECFGSYIEGAIDLLCYDRNPDGSLAPDALVIDYKTGDLSLSPSEISARHEMQARLYASVLFEQGFKQVSCRFVCVELDAGEVRGATSSGQPYIASYDFEGAVEPL